MISIDFESKGFESKRSIRVVFDEKTVYNLIWIVA